MHGIYMEYKDNSMQSIVHNFLDKSLQFYHDGKSWKRV